MLYEDAIVKVAKGGLMNGHISVYEGNGPINPCICDNYYKLFEGEDFKYLGTADEMIGKDLPRCTVGIYVGPEEVTLIVRKGGEELLNRTVKRENNNV